MTLSRDEARAVGFITLLLVVSALARLRERPAPVELTGDSLDLAALEAETQAAVAAEQQKRKPLQPGERLDPNSATAAELERLAGVGKALAERIVADREQRGAFQTLSDLDRVPGIGARSLVRLEPYLDFSGRSTPPGRRPPHHPESALLDRAGAAEAPRHLELNAASAAELERLPGIGPVLARRIVAYRDSVGGFRSLDELDRVPGIGPAMLARLAPFFRPRP